jgi:lysophospholipase L1-like esterase
VRKVLLTIALFLAALPTFAQGTNVAGATGTNTTGAGGATAAITPTSQLLQTGLLADYLLVDGSGTTIKDSSSSGNNGTFCTGNPAWGTTPTFGLTFTAASSTCVTLPAALKNAKTWYIWVDNTTVTANFQAMVSSNGTSPDGSIFYFDLSTNGVQGTTGQGVGLGPLLSDTSGGSITDNFVPMTGNGLVTLVMDTVDHQYINGVEVPNYGTQFASFPIASIGTPNLGGSPAGQGFPAATFFNGKIYRVVVYSGVHTASQVAYNTGIINSYMQGTRSLTGNFTSTRTNDQVLTVGDSQTAGFGITTPWPSIIQLTNGAWTTVNVGSTGRTMVGFSKGFVQENLPVRNPAPARNMEAILAGTNDIAAGTTAAVTEQAAESFGINLQSQHIAAVMGTMVSRNTFDAGKNSYNALLRQYWPAFVNQLCDIAANPSLGADGASASVTFFNGDAIHPNQNSHYNILAPIFQGCLNHVHANVDQSTATVYTTSATAAVATTAGSEATNTVTITFGATPANCQVGNLIILTGLTPTGYNTTVANGYGLGAGNILTRSATQVTLYNNATGLGAVSVQGTGVCTQQQDNDEYIILNNAGAQTFTMQSCEQWMGTPVKMKNIGAGSWTITPWAGLTEQIDGAATATIATGATLILWPRLVSSAAGGCNWFRGQNN